MTLEYYIILSLVVIVVWLCSNLKERDDTVKHLGKLIDNYHSSYKHLDARLIEALTKLKKYEKDGTNNN